MIKRSAKENNSHNRIITVEMALNTHLEKKNTADISYDPVKKNVYVPAFNMENNGGI